MWSYEQTREEFRELSFLGWTVKCAIEEIEASGKCDLEALKELKDFRDSLEEEPNKEKCQVRDTSEDVAKSELSEESKKNIKNFFESLDNLNIESSVLKF